MTKKTKVPAAPAAEDGNGNGKLVAPRKRRVKAAGAGVFPQATLAAEPSVIVGVGSSAGGLQALKLLMSGLDPAANGCFVMAQHVAAAHQSLLAELLAPKTSLSVGYLEKPTRPLGNHILVIPPGHDGIARDGQLVPLEADTHRARGAQPSIDRLFQTMAHEFGDRAVGVVLSGTGSDGAIGAAAIKAAGGIVLVQDPKTAQFDSMPMAVIQARAYDAILPPDQMGVALVRIARAQGSGLDTEQVLQSMPEKVLQQIKALVRRRTGFNLNHYKSSTVLRRIQRRALLAAAGSLEEYLVYLSADADEAKRLAGDLSVRVTSFFRDPHLFGELTKVINTLVERHPPGDIIRVWVPGCASGEEAYSIAMLLTEAFRVNAKAPSFLMFITDINPESLAMARLGRYDVSDLENLPSGFLQRYFETRDGIAEIAKPLRQNLVFATQNVVEDPPFSKLDLISCRNLLIYFEGEAQDHVIAAFHYALKPGGLLFLGSSENIDAQKALFEPVQIKARIYRRTTHPVVFHFKALSKAELPAQAPSSAEAAAKAEELLETPRRSLSRKEASMRARDLVAEHYAPPAIMVDEEDTIIHFIGNLSPFVTLPRGKTNWLAHQLVLPPLNAEMRPLLHRCRKEKITIRGGSYSIEISGQMRRVSLVAHPDVQGSKVFVMVAFETRSIAESTSEDLGGAGNLIRELENELANTREHLQTLIEEIENSNEELQTVNEELQSSNEELQSSNEEMHTSNEELQSANEELLTVNDELANKSEELQSTKTDLNNIKEALEIGILAVDADLKISHYNVAFLKLLGGTPPRPQSTLLTLEWDFPHEGIAGETLDVIRHKTERTRLISYGADRHLRLAIVPFRAGAGPAGPGAVLSFTDVSELIQLQDKQQGQEALFRLMLESSQTGTILTDLNGVIMEANAAVSEFSGVAHEQLMGSHIESIFDESAVAELRSNMRVVLASIDGKAAFDVLLRSEGAEAKWVAIGMSAISGASSQSTRLVLQLHDIHARKRTQDKLAAEHLQLQFLNAISRRVMESESLIELRKSFLADLTLMFDGMTVSYLHALGDVGLTRQLSVQLGGELVVHSSRQPVTITKPYLRKLRALQLSSPTNPQLDAETEGDSTILDLPISDGEELIGVIRLEAESARRWSAENLLMLRALSDTLSLAEREAAAREQRKQAFRSLRQERERVLTTLSSIGDGVITTDVHGLIESMNPAAQQLCGVGESDFQGKALFSVYQVTRGEKGAVVESVVERCLKDRLPIEDSSLDLYLVKANDTRIAINHSAAPIISSEGELLGTVLVFRDVTDTRLLARELSHRASHDSLTGLPNRAEMDRQIEHTLKEAQSGQSRHALIAFDLDRFKHVNDTAGHPAGDALLRQVANICRDKLRAADTLARVGGDEFLVLLRNCSEERAKQIAEALVAAIAALQFEWLGQEYRIGASAGVALITAETSQLSTLLDRADAACYAAKRNGRGRVELSSVDQAQSTLDTESLALIRRAIEEERCEFKSQTAVALQKDETGIYTELLMRLGAREDPSLSPDSFVTTARRHHLLVPLDQLAIRQAMRHIASLPGEKAGHVFGLNLFAESMRDAKLPDILLAAATRYGVSPSNVALEIPEQAITRDIDALAEFCRINRARGFRIAMDQFGSHLGSFSAIRTLQLDYVKINLRPQNLSLGRPEPIDHQILEALCHICRRNGTKTIAVGVEQASIADDLRSAGVDYVQGVAVSDVAR